MIQFGNYQITEKIHSHRGITTYKAERKTNRQKVILKTFTHSFPTLGDIASLSHELETVRNLHFKGIPKYLSLEKEAGQPCLVMEDSGGISLKKFIEKNAVTLSSFLKLAISISEILEEIHQKNIVHKNINSYNIWVNETTHEVMLMDFRISSHVMERKKMMRTELLDANLEYISPEQTGRMNRSVDHRSDLYSLGVALYEVLTGQKPFYSFDSIELVHYHIAKNPIPLCTINPEIPEVISAIILKLLSKNAEDRYQSAAGLKIDLEECALQLSHTKVIESFVLGTSDFTNKLQITQKLYGREFEHQTILSTFEKVRSGSTILLLIEGNSGVGKSVLVQEIYKPVTEKRGYFIEGKFDQFQRNIPYYAFISAFRDFVNFLICENTSSLDRWKSSIQSVVGSNGKVLTDVVPNLELLIGKQPEVAELPPNETQNRFNYICRNFIKTISTREHPLVIFIDDLQWADLPSLELIKLLASDAENSCLLLILSYRNNEVVGAHPFLQALKVIGENNTPIEKISLQNLTLDNVKNLISDTLKESASHVDALAKLIFNKTQGNAFFVNEFLKSLHEENVLTFDFQKKRWVWEILKIEQLNITENVVDLMAEKIQRLPFPTQQILKFAACIGSNFSMQFLILVCKQPLQLLSKVLQQVISEGLITPKDDNYKFSHDKIHQAVYSLISQADKKNIHLNIGKQLLQSLNDTEKEEYIFDIVNQISLADREASLKEIMSLPELFFMAAKKAKNAAAYLPCFEYLQRSIELLPENCWKVNYDLSLALYSEVSESAYLCGNFEQMDIFVELVLQNSKNTLDQVKAYEIRIRALNAQARLQEAVQMSLQVLELLNIEFPKNPRKLDIKIALIQIQFLLRGRNLDFLKHQPIVKDPYVEASLRLLITGSATYFVAPSLFPLFVLKAFRLIIQHGNCGYSAFVCAAYGMIVTGGLEDFLKGRQLANISLNLLETYPYEQRKSMTHVIINAFLLHWSDHLNTTLAPLHNAHKMGLEMGDFEFASYSALAVCYNSFYCGRPLRTLLKEMQQYNSSFVMVKQQPTLKRNSVFTQTVLNLLGESADVKILTGSAFKEEFIHQTQKNGGQDFSIWDFMICKMILNYLFGAYSESVKFSLESEIFIKGSMATSIIPIFYFFQSLSILAHLRGNSQDKKKLLKKVIFNQKKLNKYSKHAPMNNLHKWYLVQAEFYFFIQDKVKAAECYDLAIKNAKRNEFVNDEAICYEAASKFYMDSNQQELSKYYLQKAHATFMTWGALAKVKELESKFSFLHKHIKNENSSKEYFQNQYSATATEQGEVYQTSFSNIDLNSILKASIAISSEIELNRLLEKLIKISIENAGAQKGFLILKRENGLYIEAEGSVENEHVILHQEIPVKDNIFLPEAIIQYVYLTKENLVLGNASNDARYFNNPLIAKNNSKSILCIPIINHGEVIGILYFENNLAPEIFTKDRTEVLQLLSGQMAASIKIALNEQKKISSFIEREKLLKKINSQQVTISRAVVQTQENERRKIAEDLHDGLGYTLSTLKLNLTSLKDSVVDSESQQCLSNSFHLLEESFKELKSVSNDLMPDSLFNFGLIIAVQDLCKKINDTGRLFIKFTYFNIDRRFKKDFEIEVFRIVQEIISNVIKHADAKNLEIQFVNQDETIVITAEDDGIGFDFKQKLKSNKKGKGLINISNRVNYLYGTLSYESPLNSGTIIVIHLPLKSTALKELSHD